ncbi:hypothetical protein [uncultured Thalassolituus sp.]|jgi:hypothetical protein|uniref:hypothetical protein n=1 Tax=uncultured Thalassolituus sp. TaxID=285273 RepID=UPI002637C0D6|nr:hypothetical protein [uncultured Thalassolituus sp.]
MTQPQRHSLSGHLSSNDPARQEQLNWSQISETLTMLALAVAQIDTSMKDGNESVDTLTNSFTRIAGSTSMLLNHFDHAGADTPQEIKDAAVLIHQEIGKAVVAFQFFDRLSQRMEHVGESLEFMGHLISDPGTRYKVDSWKELQDKIKANYTMEAERIMFEHILAGQSIAEALQIYHHHFTKGDNDSFGTDDDIELF